VNILQLAAYHVTTIENSGHDYLPEINSPALRSDPSNPWFDGLDFAIQIGDLKLIQLSTPIDFPIGGFQR
jgi:hypothetical protein